jgi:hypothetical protein
MEGGPDKDFDVSIGCFYSRNTNLDFVPFAVFLCKLNIKSMFMLIKEFLGYMQKNTNFKPPSGTSKVSFYPKTIIMTYFREFSEELFTILRDSETYRNDYIYEPLSVFNGMKDEFDAEYKHQTNGFPLTEGLLAALISEPSVKGFNDLLE